MDSTVRNKAKDKTHHATPVFRLPCTGSPPPPPPSPAGTKIPQPLAKQHWKQVPKQTDPQNRRENGSAMSTWKHQERSRNPTVASMASHLRVAHTRSIPESRRSLLQLSRRASWRIRWALSIYVNPQIFITTCKKTLLRFLLFRQHPKWRIHVNRLTNLKRPIDVIFYEDMSTTRGLAALKLEHKDDTKIQKS